MKAIVQRCANASVSVDNEVISSIGKGLCVLIGISKNDSKKDMDYIVRKLLNLRIFDDDSGKRWSQSVKDKQYEVLCVSQSAPGYLQHAVASLIVLHQDGEFTLYSVLKGNKPDFHMAMSPDKSEQFYSDFVEAMKKAYSEEKIKDGKFGAYMQVSIQNDGPVTINLESPNSLKNEPQDTSQEVHTT